MRRVAACGRKYAGDGMRAKTCGRRHTTHDTRHTTHDTRHTTHDEMYMNKYMYVHEPEVTRQSVSLQARAEGRSSQKSL